MSKDNNQNTTGTGAENAAPPPFKAEIPDAKKVKRLALGELIGNIALILCLVDVIYFIVGYCVGLGYGFVFFNTERQSDGETIWFISLIISVCLLAVFVVAAALCNIKCKNRIDKMISEYVRQIFLENAALMHAERDSLSFYISVTQTSVEIKVNGYKERIIFDMTPFGRLKLSRKLAVLSAIEVRLCSTFCRLFEHGARYSEVIYTEKTNSKKTKKPVYIIKESVPDKRAYKIYLKNKN